MGVRFITSVARQLRRHATPAERELWKWLRARRLDGLKFRRQHPRNGFVHDFFCQEARLIIELDGSHHRDTFRQYANDGARDELTQTDGYSVLRFGNREVLEDVPTVLSKIRAAVACPPILDDPFEPAITPSPASSVPAPLSRQGEGPGER